MQARRAGLGQQQICLWNTSMTKPSNSNGNLSKTDKDTNSEPYDDEFGKVSSHKSVTNEEEIVSAAPTATCLKLTKAARLGTSRWLTGLTTVLRSYTSVTNEEEIVCL